MTWREDPKELAKRRKAIGLSQHALAKASGVKRSWIGAAEEGRVPLSGEKAAALWAAIVRIDLKRNLPLRKSSLATALDDNQMDRKRVVARLIDIIIRPRGASDIDDRDVAELLLEERYAELNSEEREWLAKDLDWRVQQLELGPWPPQPGTENLMALRHLLAKTPDGPPSLDLPSVKKRVTSLQKLIAKKGAAVIRETPEHAEIRELRESINLQTQQLGALNDLVRLQDELIALYQERSGADESRIAELDKQVRDLRNLYEVETEAALAHERARELRDQLSRKSEDIPTHG
jgi:transcriptional regulator with XRE-family HTH domain